ncbi:hypothetical protein [Desulforhopalus sp. 52FAK]
MNKYQVVIYSDTPDVHFDYTTAATLAKVSRQFIRLCECEELISCHKMIHGKKGLCFAEVQKLKLIRHLHEDMGFSLDAVDFLLRYRQRMMALRQQLKEQKKQMLTKDRQYEAEIFALRRQIKRLSEG